MLDDISNGGMLGVSKVQSLFILISLSSVCSSIYICMMTLCIPGTSLFLIRHSCQPAVAVSTTCCRLLKCGLKFYLVGQTVWTPVCSSLQRNMLYDLHFLNVYRSRFLFTRIILATGIRLQFWLIGT